MSFIAHALVTPLISIVHFYPTYSTNRPAGQVRRCILALAVGVLLAIAVGLFAARVGLDRDRAFYPVVLIVVASCYALFAVIGASTHALVLEVLVGTVFLIAAVWSFKSSLWVGVAGLAGHGIFDLGHGLVVSNPGMPSYWPQFCLMYDVTAAAYLAWRLRSGRIRAAH